MSEPDKAQVKAYQQSLQQTICRALEELALRLGTVETTYAQGDWQDLRKNARDRPHRLHRFF